MYPISYFLKFTCSFGLIISSLGCRQVNHQASQAPVKEKKMVGGRCDGCDIVYADMPQHIKAIDTSAAWNEQGQKLKLTGTVYKHDGKTRASDIIIYYWHTDNTGHYSPVAGMNEKAKRHGYIRGWVKTNNAGQYFIFTNKPVAYPDSDIPAHIHIVIKEPNINEYYTDEIIFDDDKLLTESKKAKLENRGGTGIVTTSLSNNILFAKHNFILGLNIPDYPMHD